MSIFQRWTGKNDGARDVQASEATSLVSDQAGKQANSVSSLYNDQESDMTFSRKLARFLSRHSWYCPTAEDRKSLDDAWAYFEHFTLSRYHVEDDDTTDRDSHVKAEKGEADKPTRLYPVLSTPEQDLADFGIGVGVYFYTMRMLSIIMLVAGILSLPNLWYFGSDEYNGVHEFSRFEVLRSSAVCTDQPWKACPTCTKSQWNYFPVTFKRYAETETEDGQLLTFILINNCSITATVGVVSFGVMLFVCLSIFILSKVARRKEQIFDESQQTTSDYAVAVRNPPVDAKDPEEWRTFFSQFGHVTSITIAYDNEELLAALILRRQLLSKMEDLLPPGMEVDPRDLSVAVQNAMPVAWYWKLYGTLEADILAERIRSVDQQIDIFSQKEYGVSEVFVIYENEACQQKALKSLQMPLVQVFRQNISALQDEAFAFKSTNVLRVIEPPEPSSVRWQDLDESVIQFWKQQIRSFFITVFFIVCGCLFVILVRKTMGTIYAAVAVSMITSAAPFISQYIIFYGESHASEGSRQISLYFKNTGFLWVTTALLTAIITPFVETLDNKADSLIPAMYAIFITEMLKSPVVQVTDMAGNFYKHILAPRARSQKKMRSFFQGKAYDLSERYTDMTNVLFLTFYYAPLFPAAYVLAAATLLVHYWVDKFCLLRVWAPAPRISSDIAIMSRMYFFSAAVIVYALMSSYDFASFPYDNACGGSEQVTSDYVGVFNAKTGDGRSVSIEIAEDDKTYFYCDQDMIQYRPPAFPALPSNQPPGFEWMTQDQDFLRIFGLASVAVIAGVVVVVLNRLRKNWRGLIGSPFESHPKRISPKCFSKVPDICGYVPGTKLSTEPYPFLFCDVSHIDLELIPWVDPEHSDYKVHNAIFDLPGLSEKPVFSTIHHWPPPT